MLNTSRLLVLVLLTSCGGGPLGDVLRYRSATGSLSRYRVVVRDVPVGAPGRTITAQADLTVERASGESLAMEARFHDVSFAREEGEPVASRAPIVMTLSVDDRRRVQPFDAPAAEGASELARVLSQSVVLPEDRVSLGEVWDLPPITRPLPDGGLLEIPRRARLAAIDDDGVATISVDGVAAADAITLHGATVAVEGRITQRFQVRAADGALLEGESDSELELTAGLPDGTEIGSAIHRARWQMQRLSDAPDGVARHDWRPDVPGGECEARLEGMRRRFALAPRDIDLDALVPLDLEPPQRSDRTPIEENAPLVIGTDRDSLRASLASVDARRALALYVLAPREVSDADVRQIFSEVSTTVELRRVAWAQTIPPSPPRPAGVVALRGRMRREGVGVWDETMRALLSLCGEAQSAYTTALEAPPRERAAQMRAGVLAGLERCGCGVTDLGRLERVMDLRLGAPQVGWAPLQEAPVEED